MEFAELKAGDLPIISSYGDGGFRLAESRLKGSILLNRKGAYPWAIQDISEITLESLAQLLEQDAALYPEVLIIGTGAKMSLPPKEFRDYSRDNNIAIEFMDTGAAARTYNVLLQEGRSVAAAIIAV